MTLRYFLICCLIGFLSACSSNSSKSTAEERYEELAKPIIEKYTERAEQFSSEVYDYKYQQTPKPEDMLKEIQSLKQEIELTEIPPDYSPWWQSIVVKQMNPKSEPVFETMDSLVTRALKNSSQIKVFSDLPLIRKTVIEEAEGKFDSHLFVESRYDLTDVPVGSDLETGAQLGEITYDPATGLPISSDPSLQFDENSGFDETGAPIDNSTEESTPSNDDSTAESTVVRQRRFEEHDWTLRAGVRKDLRSGGEVELSQQIRKRDNNSRYFNPHDQGSATLALTFRHPLLNGAGYEYNESQLEVAKIDHRVSMDEFSRQVSSHILEIQRAYWALYLERANLLQKKKSVSEAERIVTELKQRRTIDVSAHQLTLAKAVLSARYADSIRSEQAVRNAEGKLLTLVNDPNLIIDDRLEIATVESPILLDSTSTVKQAAITALQNRPEISQAFRQLKAGVVREKMAKKEMLPVLDFLIEASLKGLRGEYELGDAYSDQYDPAKPSWAVGLLFDMPLGNRIGKARHLRRLVEIRQLIYQLQTTIETVLLEVQVSVREINTAYREMLAKYNAMEAHRKKLDALNARRNLMFGGGESESIYLERLLDYQQDLSSSEQDFLTSYVAYNIAHANLDRAKGVLLQVKELQFCEDLDENKLPMLYLQNKNSSEECKERSVPSPIPVIEEEKQL